MSYRIAIASSDNENVNISFGEAEAFLIYEVDDNRVPHLIEERKWDGVELTQAAKQCFGAEGCKSVGGCGGAVGCGAGDGNIPKLELISDCRCLVCKKIGFRVEKQLEKKAIVAFDIEYPIQDVLKNIIFYFDKVDNHQSLRNFRSE